MIIMKDNDKMNADPQKMYRVIHVDKIRSALISKLQDCHDLFELDEDDMMIIIRYYKWNEEKMQQDWFTN